jgi:S-adenosylmethionine hydrolase
VAAIVTLTTDFGTRDAYVAAMKGTILGIARAVQVVDVTHELAAHDVAEGAFALEAVAPYFPAGTVHVGVVDPGVGTARRGLAVVAVGQVFVGPDNGLFTPFLGGSDWAAFELAAPEYRLRAVSPTFHGRDVFAPAAAHVAAGVDPSRLGPRVPDPVRLAWPASRRTAEGVAGVVVHVDRFGNLITSIPAVALAGLGAPAVVAIAGRRLALVSTYGELPRGGAGALVGGSGRIEIAVREGSAARLFRAGRGTRVVLSRRTTPTTRTTSSRAGASARARRRP